MRIDQQHNVPTKIPYHRNPEGVSACVGTCLGEVSSVTCSIVGVRTNITVGHFKTSCLTPGTRLLITIQAMFPPSGYPIVTLRFAVVHLRTFKGQSSGHGKVWGLELHPSSITPAQCK